MRARARATTRSPPGSASIGADCYVDPAFLEVERAEIFRRSWQFLCHEEKLREPGSYVTARVQDRGVVAIRGEDGELRAFYNVCKHRGHEVLAGAGRARQIACPYHGWVYALDGRLHRARHSERIENFDASAISLTPVQVEVFCHLVFVNIDGEAPPLADQTEGGLAREVMGYAPDLALAHLRTPPHVHGARQLEGGRRQLPRVLPLPRSRTGTS